MTAGFVRLLAIAWVLAISSCGQRSTSAPAALNEATLVEYCNDIRQRQRSSKAVAAELRPDAAAWRASVIPTFQASQATSMHSMQLEIDRLVTLLTANPSLVITARRHYAGDLRLSASAAHLRWIVPVLFESYVIAVGDHQFDLVFVPIRSGSRPGWGAIGSVDDEVAKWLSAGTQNNPTAAALRLQCTQKWRNSNGDGVCMGISAVAASAAMRGDTNAIDHACSLIIRHCT